MVNVSVRFRQVRKAAIDTLVQLALHTDAASPVVMAGTFRAQLATQGYWRLLVPCCRTPLTSDVAVETLLDVAAAAAVPTTQAVKSMANVLQVTQKLPSCVSRKIY